MKKIICATITTLLLTLAGTNTLAMKNKRVKTTTLTMKNKNQNSGIYDNRYGDPIDYNAFMFANKESDAKAMSLSKRLYAEFKESHTKLHIFERKSKDDVFEEKPILAIPTENVEYPKLLFSPDEKKIAILNSDPNTLKIHDIETNQVICEKNLESPYRHVFFSYDSTLVGYCSNDNFIEIINLKSKKPIWGHGFSSDFLANTPMLVTMAQISHDNTYVVTISNIDLFDLDPNPIKKTLKHITAAIKQYKNHEKLDLSFIAKHALEKINSENNTIYKEYIKYVTQRTLKCAREHKANPKMGFSETNIMYPNDILIQVWNIKNNNKIFCMPIFSYNSNMDIKHTFITTKEKDTKYCCFSHKNGSITICSLEEDEKTNAPAPKAFESEYDYDQPKEPMLRKFDHTGRLIGSKSLEQEDIIRENLFRALIENTTNIDQKLQNMPYNKIIIDEPNSISKDNIKNKITEDSGEDLFFSDDLFSSNEESFFDKINDHFSQSKTETEKPQAKTAHSSLFDLCACAKTSHSKKLFRGLINTADMIRELHKIPQIPIEIAVEIILFAGWKNFAYKKMYKQEEWERYKAKENNQNIIPGLTQVQTRDNKKRKVQK